MPTKDCVTLIQQAAKRGDIDTEEANRLLADLQDKARRRASDRNIPYAQALKEYAEEIKLSGKIHAKMRRRNALLSHIALNDRYNWAIQQPRWGHALSEILNQANVNGIAMGKKWQRRLLDVLESEDVIRAAQDADRETGLDVWRELRRLDDPESNIPPTKNKAAEVIARTFRDLNNEVKALKRLYGAYFSDIEGWASPQTHSAEKIRELGSKGFLGIGRDIELSFKNYRQKIADEGIKIDWERTLDGSTEDEFMRSLHASLYSGVHGKAGQGFLPKRFTLHGALANRLSAERVIHFADPDSAFRYNELFGHTDWFTSLLGVFANGGRYVSIMQTLGPNPKNNLRLLRERLLKDSKNPKLTPSPDPHTKILDLNSRKIENEWRVLNGETNLSIAHSGVPRIIDNIKALMNFKLGGVVFTSMPDPFFMKSAMAQHGIGRLERWGAMMEAMLPRGPERTQVLKEWGYLSDSILHNIHGRFMNEFSPSKWLGKANQAWFKANLLSPWTSMWERQAVEMLAYRLGEDALLPMKKLPEIRQRHLETIGIKPDDWDVLRRSARNLKRTLKKSNAGIAEEVLEQIGDRPYMSPDMVREIPSEEIATMIVRRGKKATADVIARWRDSMELKLGGYAEEFMRTAVPRPGMRERAQMTQGLPRGIVSREVMDMFWQFKGFTLRVFNNIRRAAGPEWRDVMPRMNLFSMMTQATIAAYLGWTVKEKLAGRNRPKLLDENGRPNIAVMLEAIQRSGSGGLMGDFLLVEYDRQFRTPISSALGPALGEANEAIVLGYQGAKALYDTDGPTASELGYHATRMMERNAPFLGHFFLKPFAEHFFWFNVREALSPGSLRRSERYYENEGREYWLRPSETGRIPVSEPDEKLERIMDAISD